MRYLGIYTYTPPMFPDRTYYRFCFLAQSLPSRCPTAELDTGIVGAVWMTLDELLETARARSPLVIKAVQDALLLVKNILYRSFMSTKILPL
jgi:hypothetical protein